MMITHASLFSGIGGFDLAAQWAGFENLFNCEIDPFCRQILNYHFPNATQYADIRTTDFALWRGRVDILTGGFPCQPFSLAGKRQGTKDARHLFPQMLRAIREIQPRWVVGENVFGIVNWSNGLVFEQVCADLDAEGYEVQPYLLPACGVGAPHRRDRVWFVAKDTQRVRCDGDQSEEEPRAGGLGQTSADTKGLRHPTRMHQGFEADNPKARTGLYDRTARFGDDGHATDTDDQRFKQQSRNTLADESRQFSRSHAPCGFDAFPTQSPVCSRDDGISGGLDSLTFPKWRMESIKAYGNAIVPQVTLQIMEAIKEYELNQDNQ